MPESTRAYGLIAEFDTPAATMRAAEKVRDAGFKKWDVFTPYPVHGLDKAMGLKSSKVGWFSFIGGVTGYALGNLMIWWMVAYDYAIPIAGKPKYRPFRSFPSSAHRAVPVHGPAAQAPSADAQQLLPGSAQLAVAGRRRDCAEQARGPGRQGNLSVRRQSVEHGPHSRRDQLCGNDSASVDRAIARARPAALCHQLRPLPRRGRRRQGYHRQIWHDCDGKLPRRATG